MTKDVVKTVATGAGASSPAFALKTESKGAYLSRANGYGVMFPTKAISMSRSWT